MTLKEKETRNSRMIYDRRNGLLVKDIAKKYNLSINQVLVIFRQYKAQHGGQL